MAAGKNNVSQMIEEIEFLISTQISNYFIGAGETLQAITTMQSDMFAANQWSFSTPTRANNTYLSMLITLKGVRQYTTSMYVQSYPEGLQSGYFFHPEVNGQESLRWWSQAGTKVSVYSCQDDGTIIQPPVSVDDNPGNGTLANPGNNNTLQNDIGGTQGANLNYSSNHSVGFSNVYLWEGVLYKTSFAFTFNPITGERVTFGNDWTLTLISQAISDMLAAVSFGMFAAVVEADTGYVLATSSTAPLFSGEDILTIREINDVFFKDFSALVNSPFAAPTTTSSKDQDLPTRLKNLYTYLDKTYPGSHSCFLDRTIAGGEAWKLGLNTYTIVGNPLLFVVYMNIDSVETQLNQMSIKTGYMILGIIVAFLVLGVLFTLVLTRQVNGVSRKMKLLEKLDFSKVLDSEDDDEKVSFVYELAELEYTFNEMVKVFSSVLKANASFRQLPKASTVAGGASEAPYLNAVVR
ncbi:hypothetical protein BDR26DRAFT_866671 [Obelidium mucronatum]|nr:hypothetical protein BDR26DRAFT_866671 [Obelidium mucronatum]